MPVKDWLPANVRAPAVDHKLKSGETLFRLGNKAVGVYEVIAGRVRLSRFDRSGREIVLHVAGPGETLAEASTRLCPARMPDPKKVTKQKSHNTRVAGAKAMWGTLFAFVFIISVAMSLAAIRLGL